MYKINEAATIAGITAHTLRYYEKEGILPPIERDSGGRRIYSEENIAWLDIVTCLKKTNMPMKEIKEIVRLSIIGDQTIDDRKKILMDHKRKMMRQLEELQDNISKIDKKIAFYEGADEC
ncbi:MerR family transcriptional regulator [Vallitalea okinawensis]|uniref:MerR family transcriptional regulator n=1 Tax=Vallitalea okinawensis TaxID=2078660 RepID=UPI000CFC7E85|nr:MerR family transcriptional regulator [Vallitalea okinawensis]